MRLLNIHTGRIREFSNQKIPHYFILSHRWGDGEVSFKEYHQRRGLERNGFHKIADFCSFAKERRRQAYSDLTTQGNSGKYKDLDNLSISSSVVADDDGDLEHSRHVGHMAEVQWVWMDTCKYSANPVGDKAAAVG